MRKKNLFMFGFLAAWICLLIPDLSLAERTKVIVIKDIIAVDCQVGQEDLTRLTEAVYAAATEVSPELFSVVSREKMLSITSAATAEKGKEETPTKDVGALLGADMVFNGELRLIGVRYEVTLKLMETGSGRILGLERAEAQDLSTLWTEVRKVARQILMPLATSDLATAAAGEKTREKPEDVEPLPRNDFLIQFRSTPADSKVTMDGKVICKETPCSYRVEPGEHVFTVSTEHYKDEKKTVVVDGNEELRFELEEREYNYFGMHDADDGGWAITVGVSPLDTDYKSITVLDGFTFANLHPVFDIGFGGGIFGYRQTDHGASWSILGFGPVVRFGRVIISSQVQLLSFRPNPTEFHEDGWLPGITVRAQIPLINHREGGGWAALVPTPTAGYDVWFADLDYDQQQFWLGLSWLGGIDF